MKNALTQLLAHASIHHVQTSSMSRESSQGLLQQLTYEDLVQFAHEVGNALAVELPGAKRLKLRQMYQQAANEHHARLNGGRLLV